MAQYPLYPVAKLVAEIPVETGVVLHGVEFIQASGPLLVPSPSSPKALAPQQSTPPEVRIAQKFPVQLPTRLVAEMPIGSGVVLQG